MRPGLWPARMTASAPDGAFGSPGNGQQRVTQNGTMSRVEVDDGWRFVSIGHEGQQTDVAGVNPWEVGWTATGSRITVAHPQYPAQRHQMLIYEVTGSAPPIRFAAGEFSNGVWGFFVPAPLDESLIGYWSDESLYQGAMEAADIAFRSDGTGWTDWSRDGGPFHVYRFSWHTSAGHQLTLALDRELSGTWELQNHTTRYRVESQTGCDEQIMLTYEIRPGQDALKAPAKLLQFDKPISLGTIGDRFAFKHELGEDEQDPTTRRP